MNLGFVWDKLLVRWFKHGISSELSLDRDKNWLEWRENQHPKCFPQWVLRMSLLSFHHIQAVFLLLLLPSRSRVRLCATPETAAHQAPRFLGFSRQELEWVAISFSNAWKWKVKVKSLSRVRLLETPWTTAHQAPPSMGFSRQEYWSGLPVPSLLISVNGWISSGSIKFRERKRESQEERERE